jgi:hypothetical protein
VSPTGGGPYHANARARRTLGASTPCRAPHGAGGPFFPFVYAYPSTQEGVCVYAREKGTTPRGRERALVRQPMRFASRKERTRQELIFTQCEAVETDTNWFSRRDSEFARGVHSKRILARDGFYLHGEVAESRPFADAVRMRRGVIPEKHKLHGNDLP